MILPSSCCNSSIHLIIIYLTAHSSHRLISGWRIIIIVNHQAVSQSSHTAISQLVSSVLRQGVLVKSLVVAECWLWHRWQFRYHLPQVDFYNTRQVSTEPTYIPLLWLLKKILKLNYLACNDISEWFGNWDRYEDLNAFVDVSGGHFIIHDSLLNLIFGG